MSILNVIVKRDLKAIFKDPLFMVLMALYTFFLSYSFIRSLFSFEKKSMGQVGGQEGAFFHEVVMSQISLTHLLLLFFIPLICMRLITYEKGTGAFKLYDVLSVLPSQLILAKTFVAFILIFILVGVSGLYPLLSGLVAYVDFKLLFIANLGLLLTVFVYVGVSIFAALLTSSPLFSGFISFVFIMMLLLVGDVTRAMDLGVMKRIFDQFSIASHFRTMVQGGVYLSSLGFYFSTLILGLVLSIYLRSAKSGQGE